MYAKRFSRGRRFPRRSRKPSGRAGFVRGANAAYTLARQAVKGVKYIKGLVNSEMFKKDVSGTSIGFNTSAGVYHLTAIAQDDTVAGRTGNSVLVKSVNIKGNVSLDSAGANTNGRIVVVMDTQQVGDTAPAWTDVYESSLPYSHLNKATVGRFKILWSKNLEMIPTSESAMYNININIPLQHHVRFNGTASSDVQKGGIYLMILSDRATSYPTLNYESRVSYHDN